MIIKTAQAMSGNQSMRIILPFLLILISRLNAQQIQFSEIDVLHYQAEIEPDISRKTIIGSVTITFKVVTAGGKITFDCGDLQIESIQSNGKQLPFEIRNRKVSIDPGVMVNQSSDIVIHYHGAPTRGINFFPNQEEVYTVFTTSEWLVCKDQPDDKATLALKITIPSTLKAVGSGELRKQTRLDGDKIVIEWNLQQPFPTYTYGFAIGPYNEFVDSSNDLTLRYLSAAYTSTELEKIFAETRSIIQFFEQRSGVKYHSNLYAQVLGEGNVSQEMAGFTVMRLNYGKQVLDNSTDINLAAHELAHQWWGNRVTCVNWNHFWLNEGFAVFMSSAYKEFKFGHDHYLKDITTYQDAYQAVVKKGLDKPLTFPSWLNPTGDDRTLVYYKGAYVLHLLREQLGEKAFWDGVKLYTSAYVGKSVTAKEFRQVMEKVSGQDLGLFFSKWIEGRR